MAKQTQNIPVNINASEVTQEMIDTWKSKYESVHKLTVGDKEAYIRFPDRKTMSYAQMAANGNNLKLGEIILNKCWLAGDMEIQELDSYFYSANNKLEGIIELKSGSLEKL